MESKFYCFVPKTVPLGPLVGDKGSRSSFSPCFVIIHPHYQQSHGKDRRCDYWKAIGDAESQQLPYETDVGSAERVELAVEHVTRKDE
jgi:hypothetical protein